jgi:hypothetical protein
MLRRRIEVEVGGARAAFVLLDWAPKASALVWATLPYRDVLLRHAKLSGDAAFAVVENDELSNLPARAEFPVTSIYKGYIVLNAHPEARNAELLIAYGLGEYRWPDGRRYVSPIAELEGDGAALYDELKKTWVEGAGKITIRRADA